MKTCVGYALAFLMLSLGAVAVDALDVPTMTDAQRLRAELQVAREQLLQAQYQLATCQAQQQANSLASGRKAIEAEVPDGFRLDWQTLTLKPVEK